MKRSVTIELITGTEQVLAKHRFDTTADGFRQLLSYTKSGRSALIGPALQRDRRRVSLTATPMLAVAPCKRAPDRPTECSQDS